MTTLLSYSLCTLADVKETLGIDSGNHDKDNLITRKINQATKMIENYCGRRFKYTAYTQEIYNATGTDQLVLKNAPIDTTQTMTLESRNSALNQDNWQTISSEFSFVDANAGILDLSFNTIGHFARYRVTYTAGYATIPEDIQEACATLAAYLTTNPTTGMGIRKKQEGQRMVEYFDNTSMSIIEQLGIDDILSPYILTFVGGTA